MLCFLFVKIYYGGNVAAIGMFYEVIEWKR